MGENNGLKEVFEKNISINIGLIEDYSNTINIYICYKFRKNFILIYFISNAEFKFKYDKEKIRPEKKISFQNFYNKEKLIAKK